MKIPKWFREEWIKDDERAIGVYKALLYTRFRHGRPYAKIEEFKYSVKKEILGSLVRAVADNAWRYAEMFLEAFFSHEACIDESGTVIRWVKDLEERLKLLYGYAS